MPQILDAFVLFASMMQRYEIFTTYARKWAIIFLKEKQIYQNRNFLTFSLSHLWQEQFSIFIK